MNTALPDFHRPLHSSIPLRKIAPGWDMSKFQTFRFPGFLVALAATAFRPRP